MMVFRAGSALLWRQPQPAHIQKKKRRSPVRSPPLLFSYPFSRPFLRFLPRLPSSPRSLPRWPLPPRNASEYILKSKYRYQQSPGTAPPGLPSPDPTASALLPANCPRKQARRSHWPPPRSSPPYHRQRLLCSAFLSGRCGQRSRDSEGAEQHPGL